MAPIWIESVAGFFNIDTERRGNDVAGQPRGINDMSCRHFHLFTARVSEAQRVTLTQNLRTKVVYFKCNICPVRLSFAHVGFHQPMRVDDSRARDEYRLPARDMRLYILRFNCVKQLKIGDAVY